MLRKDNVFLNFRIPMHLTDTEISEVLWKACSEHIESVIICRKYVETM